MLAMIVPLGTGQPDNELPGGGPPGVATPPIVIPPIGIMPPIYIPPVGVRPPIYYPPGPSQGPGFPTHPIAPGGEAPGVWPNPPEGVWPNPPGLAGGRPTHPIYQPPVVWPGPTPPPPASIWPPPESSTKPIPIPPDAVYPPLSPNHGLGKTLVLAWIAGAGWHWLLLDLSQPKK